MCQRFNVLQCTQGLWTTHTQNKCFSNNCQFHYGKHIININLNLRFTWLRQTSCFLCNQSNERRSTDNNSAMMCSQHRHSPTANTTLSDDDKQILEKPNETANVQNNNNIKNERQAKPKQGKKSSKYFTESYVYITFKFIMCLWMEVVKKEREREQNLNILNTVTLVSDESSALKVSNYLCLTFNGNNDQPDFRARIEHEWKWSMQI